MFKRATKQKKVFTSATRFDSGAVHLFSLMEMLRACNDLWDGRKANAEILWDKYCDYGWYAWRSYF